MIDARFKRLVPDRARNVRLPVTKRFDPELEIKTEYRYVCFNNI